MDAPNSAFLTVDETAPSWDNLPESILTQIFDNLLRAPTPHPVYLPTKLQSWTSLFRVSHQWRAAIRETGVGVCLPTSVDTRMMQWLKQVWVEQMRGGWRSGMMRETSATAHGACVTHGRMVEVDGW